MDSNGLFGKTISLMEKVLDLRSAKHNVIASNIANVDTPNYRSFNLIVEEELKKTKGHSGLIPIEKTHPMHLSNNAAGLNSVQYKLTESPNVTLRGDRNSVDLDKEMAKMTENNIMFNALTQIIARKFEGLKSVIHGGK